MDFQNERMLTNKQLREVFHVSPNTLRNWARKGKLSPIKIDGKVYYRPEDIRTLCAIYSADRISQPAIELRNYNNNLKPAAI